MDLFSNQDPGVHSLACECAQRDELWVAHARCEDWSQPLWLGRRLSLLIVLRDVVICRYTKIANAAAGGKARACSSTAQEPGRSRYLSHFIFHLEPMPHVDFSPSGRWPDAHWHGWREEPRLNSHLSTNAAMTALQNCS